MKSFNQRKFYRRVFREVMSYYERKRARTCSGTSKLDGGGGSHSCKASFPSDSDYICDVELAGRAVLRNGDLEYFEGFYLNAQEEAADKIKRTIDKESYQEYKRTIQEKVGRECLSRRIYPVAEYMHEPSGATGSQRCKCKAAAHIAGKSAHVWCAGGCGLNMTFHDPTYWEVDTASFKLWCHECQPRVPDAAA